MSLKFLCIQSQEVINENKYIIIMVRCITHNKKYSRLIEKNQNKVTKSDNLMTDVCFYFQSEGLKDIEIYTFIYTFRVPNRNEQAYKQKSTHASSLSPVH